MSECQAKKTSEQFSGGPSPSSSPPQRVVDITFWKRRGLVQQPSLSAVKMGHALQLRGARRSSLPDSDREGAPASHCGQHSMGAPGKDGRLLLISVGTEEGFSDSQTFYWGIIVDSSVVVRDNSE